MHAYTCRYHMVDLIMQCTKNRKNVFICNLGPLSIREPHPHRPGGGVRGSFHPHRPGGGVRGSFHRLWSKWPRCAHRRCALPGRCETGITMSTLIHFETLLYNILIFLVYTNPRIRQHMQYVDELL